MALYMKFGPYLCIASVLLVLFVLWAFCGGKNYDFVGLNPLNPDTCGSYTGSLFNLSKINQNVCPAEPQQHIDNTPDLPSEFDICVNNPSIEDQPVTVSDIQHPPKPEPSCKSSKGKFISKGERLCCETMEKIYNVEFKSSRPHWLVNPETGCRLELDCYNEDLQLAVEYNGVQHYTWPNFTNQTQEQFINQVRRDKLKMELCNRNDVYLIVVPYNVPHKKIPEFITSHLPETIKKRLHEEHILNDIQR